MKRVAIIDYGHGNIFSISQALKKLSIEYVIADNKDQIESSSAIILPGVGAFNSAMEDLQDNGLESVIIDNVKTGKPLLGICLGMQLLFESSEEFGIHKGLGLLKGDVVKFKGLETGFKIPQTQWNKVFSSGCNSKLFKGIESINPFMYFVHSYYVRPSHKGTKIISTNYGGLDYCCAIELENIYAVQFHPEKSSNNGLQLLKNFCDMI